MNIRLPISSVKQNTGQIEGLPSNPRQWTQADIDRIAKSLKETPELFEARPLIVYLNGSDYIILGGNLRYEGARKNKMKEVPVHILPPDLSIDKLKEIVIKDNGSFGDWDMDALGNEWDDLPLKEWGVDIAWDDVFLEESSSQERKEVEEDDFDEEKDHIEVRCKRGDIWQLGDHRLMCGDSVSLDDVKKLMGGHSARLLFTSPPYADMRTYNGNKDLSVDSLARFIPTYECFVDYQCVNLGIQLKEREIIQYWDAYIDAAKSVGYKLMSWSVWDKMGSMSVASYTSFIIPNRHEWIFVFGKDMTKINLTWDKKEESIKQGIQTTRVRQKDGGFALSTKGDCSNSKKKMESIVSIPASNGEVTTLHPATFPVALPSEYIKAFTNENDIVIEPFGGSGTTLIAAEQLGRKARVMELDEHYCDVIIARWEKFTGKQATKIN